MGHEAGNEGHVAGKPVQLGNNDRTLALPAGGPRCSKLRPSVEGVAPLPCFNLDIPRKPDIATSTTMVRLAPKD